MTFYPAPVYDLNAKSWEAWIRNILLEQCLTKCYHPGLRWFWFTLLGDCFRTLATPFNSIASWSLTFLYIFFVVYFEVSSHCYNFFALIGFDFSRFWFTDTYSKLYPKWIAWVFRKKMTEEEKSHLSFSLLCSSVSFLSSLAIPGDKARDS